MTSHLYQLFNKLKEICSIYNEYKRKSRLTEGDATMSGTGLAMLGGCGIYAL